MVILMSLDVEHKPSPSRDTVSVVERAFFVLQVVAAEPESLGVRELARRTDLPPATVLRLVRTLEALGMVARRAGGLVSLGPGVATLTAAGPRVPTAERLMPLLGRIVDTFAEGATAGIDDGDTTLFVAHVAPVSAVQIADVTGDRWPAHTTASGIVLMSGWIDDRLDAYLDGDLDWSAPNTMTDPALLGSRIDQVRTDGYAWSVEELVADATGLAVPLRNSQGTIVAAVGLYAPTYRLHPELAHLADLPHRLIDLVDRLTPSLISD